MNENEKVDLKNIKKIVQTETVQKAIEEAIKTEQDILLHPVGDRRILPNVPDKNHTRTNIDRRGIAHDENNINDYEQSMEKEHTGKRYIIDYPIVLNIITINDTKIKIKARGVNISSSGLLCRIPKKYQDVIEQAAIIKISFEIKPGTMPEGYEMKIKNIKSKWVRTINDDDENYIKCGFQFKELLAQYAYRKRQFYMLTVASIFLFLVSLFIILLRAESVIYFEFNKTLYLYNSLC